MHRSISSDASNNLDENDADNYEPWEFNLKDEFLKSLMLDDETGKNVHDYIFDDSVITYKLNHHNTDSALKWIPSMCNTDIFMIHNNSDVHGLTEPLLTCAIKLGGNVIDFADGEATINVIRGLGLEEYGRVKWDNKCVRTSWSHRNSSLSDIMCAN